MRTSTVTFINNEIIEEIDSVHEAIYLKKIRFHLIET